MYKKTISSMITLLFLCIVCVIMLPTNAEAAEVAGGTCGKNLTWVLDDKGTLTISGTGEMRNYSSYSYSNVPWYSQRGSIINVVIEDGVTSIGSYAFYYCSSLTSITIPDSVTSIGYDAFYYCSSLTSITIPDGVTSIGSYAFYYCSSLTSVTIGNGVTSIGYAAFRGCSSLNAVYINDLAAWFNITFALGDFDDDFTSNPLYYAGYLYINGELATDIVVPDGTTSIGNCAFINCRGLTSITIPNSVTSIGKGAFLFCSS